MTRVVSTEATKQNNNNLDKGQKKQEKKEPFAMAFRKTSSVLDYVSSTSPPKPFKGRPRTMSIQVPTGTTDILGNDHGDYKILKKKSFNLCAFKTSTVTSKFVKILCCQSIKFTLSTEFSMTFVKYVLDFYVLGSSSIQTCRISNIFCIFLQAGADVNIKTNIRNSTRS